MTNDCGLRKRTSAVPRSVLLIGGVLLSSVVTAATSPPDLSGIWRAYREGAPRAAATQTAGQTSSGESNRPATNRGWPVDAPLRPEAKVKVEEYRALIAAHNLVTEGQDSPGAFCLGTGMPGSVLGAGGYPMEIIQRPEQITIIYELHTEIRRVYLDEKSKKLDQSEIFPSRNGFSIGRWEGDTLVVETTRLKEQVDQAAAHSDQALIIERYRLSESEQGRKILTAELTMTDPVFYTAPVTVTKKWEAADASARMMHYDCNETTWLDHIERLQEAAAKRTSAKMQYEPQ
jgi:hypothetical protein